VTSEGNFEHKNILNRTIDLEQTARLFGRSVEEVSTIVADARRRLLAARATRIAPAA
jgi:uncharacterized protein YyaL (SSP411 family)